MCQQLWLKFASAELALRFTGAFEDEQVLNNDVQEITSSCEACWAKGPLEWVGYGLGQQWCDDDRLGGHSASRTHRGANVGAWKTSSTLCVS